MKKFTLFTLIILLFTVNFSYAKQLSVGSISSDPAKENRRFKPFIDYLSQNLKESGIDSVELVIASSLDEMIQLMRHGDVDIFLDSPFPSLTMMDAGVSKIVLSRWKKGVEKYHSVIFVRRDSDIRSIFDLKNKIIAFEEPFSTSSYYIPKASILQESLLMKELSSRHQAIPEDEIGYVFSDDDVNTVTWVRKKLVDAGAINDITFNSLKDKFKDSLRIIFNSIEVPRQVVNFRIGMDSKLEEALIEVLISMSENEYGKEQLKAFENTKRFDRFTKSIEETMLPLRNLAKYIK
ncbi:MAG: phosphate/phosphite/phosphonate ABC transporter substrate-binding protein [Saccharospirillaceae bacterium]|nr:phosphate/phosphite/phosphonate ABC transporter substrate-binding protein [Saccharospirillaceae bacterium]